MRAYFMLTPLVSNGLLIQFTSPGVWRGPTPERVAVQLTLAHHINRSNTIDAMKRTRREPRKACAIFPRALKSCLT